MAAGFFRLKGGTQVVINWTGQPMFSFGLIAGGLLIASATIPQRLIDKLSTVKNGKLRTAHYQASPSCCT